MIEQIFDPNVTDHSDMYVGCFDGYGWDQIKYLVNSLDRSGFSGRKVMIVLATEKATVEKLASKGWYVIHFGKIDADGNYLGEPVNIPVHVLRFYYLSYLLEEAARATRSPNLSSPPMCGMWFSRRTLFSAAELRRFSSAFRIHRAFRKHALPG